VPGSQKLTPPSSASDACGAPLQHFQVCVGMAVNSASGDLAQAKDGSLLFSDDGNGTIWSVSYEGRSFQ